MISKEFLVLADLSFIFLSSHKFNESPCGQIDVCALFLDKKRHGKVLPKEARTGRTMFLLKWSGEADTLALRPYSFKRRGDHQNSIETQTVKLVIPKYHAADVL
jgi:hypothetical protein